MSGKKKANTTRRGGERRRETHNTSQEHTRADTHPTDSLAQAGRERSARRKCDARASGQPRSVGSGAGSSNADQSVLSEPRLRQKEGRTFCTRAEARCSLRANKFVVLVVIRTAQKLVET